MEDGNAHTRRAVDLLSGAHRFPGPFKLQVVLVPEHRETVLDAVRARVGPGAVSVVAERASSRGTWLAVHVMVEVDEAATVLELYAILRGVDGVVTVL